MAILSIDPYTVVDYSLPLHMGRDKLYKRVYIDEDGCWIWKDYKNHKGYGQLHWKGELLGAHVLSYRIATNTILPYWVYTLHHCDKPSCIKPACLFKGTPAVNTKDSMDKGRHSRGEKHGSAILTYEKADEIRELYATGNYRQVDLGIMYGVSGHAISMIVTYQRWVR